MLKATAAESLVRETEDNSTDSKEFEEKPLVSSKSLVSTGIYVFRRRQLIEMIERAGAEDGFDLVKDIFIRYKGV